jgi:hypothetical protein
MADHKESNGWEKKQAAAIYLLLQRWKRRTFDRDLFVEDGVELLTQPLSQPYVKAGQTLAQKFDMELPASLRQGRWAEAYAKRFTRELATNVAADLRTLGKEATADQVSLIFSRGRAARGGATAVTQAISAGELDAAGVVEKIKGSKLQVRWLKDWRSTRICKVCQRLHGTLSANWSLEFPMGPPAHPWCRCRLEFS